MKKYSLLNVLALIIFFFISGCKKEAPVSNSTYINPSPPPPPPPPPVISNTAPTSYAGQDIIITLPTNFCTLSGQAHDIENNIRTILWSKISGPSSFRIEHPDSLATKVNDLQKGIYQFELTVTDSLGLYEKDRVNVIVNEPLTGGNHWVHVMDRLVYYPTNFTSSIGSYSGTLQSVSWSKISGPSSFLIESPNSFGTRFSNLQEGVYQFKVVVQNTAGLTDSATCTVVVGQFPSNPSQIILENLSWGTQGLTGATLLWGSGIIIPNIYQYQPAVTVFKAYIKRDNTNTWEELMFDNYNSYYSVSLMNGNLGIWSQANESDTPDIKLLY